MPSDHDILIAIQTTVDYIKENMVTQDQCASYRAQNGYARTEKALTAVQAKIWAVALIIITVGVSALVAHLTA